MLCRNKTTPTETDVAIIGNGTSAIFLSYLLNGNMAYYKGGKIQTSDNILHKKLMKNKGIPIQEQDLQYLSEHLYGEISERSNNLISILVDSLLNHEDKSLLTWKRTEKKINHVVIGNKKPGGVWSLEENNKSKALSFKNQLQLPGLSFHKWQKLNKLVDIGERPSRNYVSRYYADYISYTGIEKNFYNYLEVVKVVNIKEYTSKYHECPCKKNSNKCWKCSKYKYFLLIVNVIDYSVQYLRCNYLVLAMGAFNSPVKLNIMNEYLNYVYHDFKHTPYATDLSPNDFIESNELPILIIGSGFSAADAIIKLKNQNKKIILVYYTPEYYKKIKDRKYGKHPLSSCNKIEYPEYYEILQLMVGKPSKELINQFDQVELFPDSKIIEFKNQNQVIVQNKQGKEIHRKVESCLVLIGRGNNYNSDLFEGKLNILNTNPDDINVNTFSVAGFSDIYSIGSLATGKLVRFLLGSAFSVHHCLLNSICNK